MKNITQAIRDEPRLSTLVGALEQFDFITRLDEPGPFTVFAPSNKAIGKVIDSLPTEGAEFLKLLQRHVAPGRITDDKFSENKERVKTLNGLSELTIWREGETKMIQFQMNTYQFKEPAMELSNGVIHIISDVIMPSNNSITIAQAIRDEPRLSMLIGALDKSNLTAELEKAGNFTVFAPSNEAIGKVVDSLPIDGAEFRKLLQRHVAPFRRITDETFKNLKISGNRQLVRTMNDLFELTIWKEGETKMIKFEMNTYQFKEPDMDLSNGVIHIISDVIMSPNINSISIAQSLRENPKVIKLKQALEGAKLMSALEKAGPFTVFAPEDGPTMTAVLASIPKGDDELKKFLLRHVVPGKRITDENFSERKKDLFAMNGDDKLTIWKEGKTKKIELNGGAVEKVIGRFADLKNGEIYLIEGPLLMPVPGSGEFIALKTLIRSVHQ